jgi:dihydrofolate reductase
MKKPAPTVSFSAIVAIDEEGGMGRGGRLAWNFPADLLRFRQITSPSSNLVMGYKTYKEMAQRRSDLLSARGAVEEQRWILSEHRCLHVLSRDPSRQSPYQNVRFHTSKENLMKVLQQELVEFGSVARVNYVVGGPDIYVMFKPETTSAYVTLIPGTYRCDVFLPSDYINGFSLAHGSAGDVGPGPLFQFYTKESQ